MSGIAIDKVKKGLPEEWEGNGLRDKIRKKVLSTNTKIIALDDDPTGTQTVYDVPVLTVWDRNILKETLAGKDQLIYILTNSRAFPEEKAVEINKEIASNIIEIASKLNINIELVSRSDSTLRGHYPLETQTLQKVFETGLDINYDGEIIIPFFPEGGRVTVNNVHLVQEGDYYIPAGETEFARDTSFGYNASSLPEWVEEKTGGEYQADDVICITLSDIRNGGPEQVYQRLMESPADAKIIVNSFTYQDLDVFVLGLLKAEEDGKKYIFRTAASFLKVRAGLSDQELLISRNLINRESLDKGGLVVVGSHVPRSTRQLNHLIENTDIKLIELKVQEIIDSSRSRKDEIRRVSNEVNSMIGKGNNIVVYTTRKLIRGKDDLKIGEMVSNSLVQIVKEIEVQPSFFLAKGGITSSDLATKALGITKARVMGQILPGVPVWLTEENNVFPDLPYIIFPGNVGKDDSITSIVNSLSEK